MYILLNIELRDDKMLQLKNKWEIDIQHESTLKEWQSLLQTSQITLTNTKHRLTQFNVLHRIYYTPYGLYQCSHETSPRCHRWRPDPHVLELPEIKLLLEIYI